MNLASEDRCQDVVSVPKQCKLLVYRRVWHLQPLATATPLRRTLLLMQYKTWKCLLSLTASQAVTVKKKKNYYAVFKILLNNKIMHKQEFNKCVHMPRYTNTKIDNCNLLDFETIFHGICFIKQEIIAHDIAYMSGKKNHLQGRLNQKFKLFRWHNSQP